VKKNRQAIADNTCCKVCGSLLPVGLPDPTKEDGGILGSKFCPHPEWVEGRPAWKYECVEPKMGLEKCGESK